MFIRHDFLRQLRLQRNLTQEEVAAATGLDVRQVRKYESGQVSFNGRADTFQNLQVLARFCGVPVDDLIIRTLPAPRPLSAPPDPPGRRFRGEDAGYVHRPREENAALDRLRGRRSALVLQGPWMQGKATLIGYLRTRPECTGARIVGVDLGTLRESECDSLDSLVSALGQRLLPEPDSPPRRRGRAGSAVGRFTRGVVEPLLREAGALVLVLERADRLLPSPSLLSDFFALLRGWVDGDPHPSWDGLRLIISVSADTSLLERADHSSFFALANPIRLPDFDEAQLGALAAAHGLDPGPRALARLQGAVGGHPFLSRQAMNHAREQSVSLDTLLETDLSADVYRHHLATLLRWLDERPVLRDATRRLLADPLFDLSPHDPTGQLCAQGLTVEHGPRRYRLRCALYERYLRSALSAS